MPSLFPPGPREPLIREIKLPFSIDEFHRRISATHPYSAFLKSETDSDCAQFSFVGCNPYLVFRSKGRSQTIELASNVIYRTGDPFDTLKEIIDGIEIKTEWKEAPFFAGGIGAFGYDLGGHIEKLPHRAVDDTFLPDLVFVVYKTIVISDRFSGRMWISAVDYSTDKGGAAEEILIDNLLIDLNRPEQPRTVEKTAHSAASRTNKFVRATHASRPVEKTSPSEPVSCFTKENYLNSVRKCLDHIYAGDVYQVNLSQRFRCPATASSIDYFDRLSEINPAPFSAFLDCDSFQIVSSSPERFLKLTGGMVETRPIKGTSPRGANAQEDAQTGAELLNSEKDNAELAMIIDLERNDLGRVCEYGSVQVKNAKTLEKFSTVFHLVGIVEGKLRSDCGPVELLKATFPGGSITGCPKIRSMEIIDYIEPVRRGFYTGSIGYIGFNGDMDLNIVIRTLTIKGGEVFLSVGGGIVADSDPELEYEETLHKARALFDTLSSTKPADGNVYLFKRK